MARVLINGLASTAGGGVTYLRNVLPRLAAAKPVHQYLVLVPEAQLSACLLVAREGLEIESVIVRGGALGRWAWEQFGLRRLIRSRQIQVLVSLGNFGLLAAPVPQILYQRNALYFSAAFAKDLWRRRQYRAWGTHLLKKQMAYWSLRMADCNVAPSSAFAKQLRVAGKYKVELLPFGFDHQNFAAQIEPLPPLQQVKLTRIIDCYRLLFVSHYNYFRNFETLLRALPLIKAQVKRVTGKKVKLILTAVIKHGISDGGYDTTGAAQLIEKLDLNDDIVMLGKVGYEHLHQLYRQADLFVCPSYAESFGHPLVEAMAFGLPVVAADLAVQREICGEAASYFDTFAEQSLAEQCVRLLAEPALYAKRKQAGLERSCAFSWEKHCRQLSQLIEAYATDGK